MASKYLKKKGYFIISNNYKTKFGEIDIIAKKENKIVFVEVKTRTSLKYGSPKEAVNQRKIRHIINVSNYFLNINNIKNPDVRFDVIEIVVIKNQIFLNHIENIFS